MALPGSKPWEEDNPAPCPTCEGEGARCDFCAGMGIIPRWVVEQWDERG
ncbi:MAG: hypothetical protein HOZ81_20465 [Streptomyces sp.]|nr:hypothetical protein [Streptomyces sp.]